MRSKLRVICAVGAFLPVVALTGCTSSQPAAKAGTCLAPFAAASAGPSASAGTSASTGVPASAGASAGVGGGPALPSMNLGCLDGSGDVTLAANGRPMIVSFWASYCGPCQAESPQLEAFAKAANGGVEVVGVDTADIDSKGRSFVAGLGLTYPMVADPDTRLLKAVAKPYLPTLLFVTSQGRIAHSYQKNQLDVATLRTLTSTYLGVQVSG